MKAANIPTAHRRVKRVDSLGVTRMIDAMIAKPHFATARASVGAQP
jgi:hypothetical protein